MKVEALVRSLESVAGDREKESLFEFSVVARRFGGAKTLKAFLVAIESAAAKPDPAWTSGPSLGGLLKCVEVVTEVARAIASKAVVAEIEGFYRVLRAHSDISIRSLQLVSTTPTKKAPPALREGLVAQYKRDIETLRIGSDELTSLFAKLREDKKMRAVEMAALASAVAYETAATTKRPDALKRVMQRHESFLTSAAKSDAMKGSSAT